MASPVSGSNRVTWRCRYRALSPLSGVIVLSGTALSCVPEPRPLTINEKNIRILPATKEATAELEKDCKIATTVSSVPTAGDADVLFTSFVTGSGFVDPVLAATAGTLGYRLNTAFSASEGTCWPGKLGSWDDVRRCAGEHRVQAVQVTGLDVVRQETGGDWKGRLAALDLRFLKCPASRAKDGPGELVWRRRQGFHAGQFELVKDGQVVGHEDDAPNLPNLVAAYPPAVEYAKSAQEHLRSASRSRYASLPFVALALAGDALAVVGAVKGVKRNPWLFGGGLAGGIVFTSVSVWLLVDGIDSVGRATTDAMNAVDSYNDNYIHHQPEPVAQ